MHELSVATAVLNTAIKHAGDRRVSVVSLRVGRLRQVVPDSLSFYFEIVARDTACEGADLQVREIETELQCRVCAHAWSPEIPAFRCPHCGDADVAVRAGEELEVDYIEVEDAEDKEKACTAPR
jgi:hydrogenase nickel incorporation protein HypA/HybF